MTSAMLEERLDYGISQTKRCTVPTAEEILGEKISVLKQGKIQLVDYMGGDEAIINAATNYYGLAAVNNMDPKDFMYTLRKEGIRRPFRFAEIKVNMAMPISAALTIVPFEEANVNEYSGRYSVMSDEFHNPVDPKTEIGKVIEANFVKSRADYQRLISEDIDLARELARIVLPIANYTQCYWKVNLESLFTFFRENRRSEQPHLRPFVDRLRDIASRVAPLAYDAFERFDEQQDPLPKEREVELAFDLRNIRDSELTKKTRQLTLPYGINETKRLTVPAAEEHMFKIQPVLDHGFVSLIDYMGTDESIVQAARVSYGRGTKKVSEDRGLIRYLERHHHTTPSEMIELAFIAKLPLFIERQLVRHRTVDKVGFLDRFALESDMYIPAREELRRQSATNRQGRGNELEEHLKDEVLQLLENTERESEISYELLDQRRSSNDIARQVRPVGSFTGWCIKSDVKNLFHLLGLRLDTHAQKESRVYAEAIAQVVKSVAPTSYESFEDYRMNAMQLSAKETSALRDIMHGGKVIEVLGKIENKREREELEAKLKKLLP